MLATLYASCLHFFYPPLCVHCKTPLPVGHLTLCASCLEELTQLNNVHRCGFCFQEQENENCTQCRGQARFCDYKAAVFELSPCIRTLLYHFKHTSPYLAPSLASYLFLQHEALGWPTPDYIAFVPPYRKFSKISAPQLLAQELGKLLKTPALPLIKKKSLTLYQENLCTQDREMLALNTFALNSPLSMVEDKTILLIDDFMVTGRTLECCAYALLEGSPKRIYGLCVGIA